MKIFTENIQLAGCGTATSLLTAIVVVATAKWTGFNLFSLTVWVVIPIGAVIAGLAAASGYYFGALHFHRRATRALLIQMTMIAALTQVLIYGWGYATAKLDDGQALPSAMSFFQYLHTSLADAHLKLQLKGHEADIGRAGSLGYWAALIQFLGFLGGGLYVYTTLTDKAVCPSCNLYLRPLLKKPKHRTFPDAAAASAYYDRVFGLPMASPEFLALMGAEHKIPKGMKSKPGAVYVATELFGCPDCKKQLVEENVKVRGNGGWALDPARQRRVPMPHGVDLVPLLRT
ncbi:MAG: hypothetical protein ABI605_04540 [Rhizobacter sp.]